MLALKSAVMSQRLTLGIGLAILLVIGATSIGVDVKTRADSASVDHTLGVLSRIADLRLLVSKAESASRGFALTGDETLARDFRDIETRIPAAVADLKAAVSDNPSQQELVESAKPLLTRRLAVSSELVRLRAQNDSAGMAALTARAEGRATMSKLLTNLDQLRAREQELLAVRSSESQSSGRLMLIIDLVGVVMILTLVAFLTRAAYLSNSALVTSLRATRATNVFLEAEVAVQEEHLGAAQSVMENTFNSIAEAVLVIDPNGAIVLSNPAAERLLGYRMGMTIADLWAANTFCQPDGITPLSFEERPSTVALGGQPLERKEVIVRPVDDGKTLHVMVSGRPLRDAAGDVSGASLVFHDITDIQETERKLRQAQRLEAVGKLTGGVAHDFNNMLTVITVNMEVLMDDLKDHPEALQMAGLINQAADRCTELIQHLLAFARKQPLRPRNVDINNTVLEIAKLLRPTLGGQIEIDSILTQEIASAHVDPSQLASALVNMAINARDAMTDGGRLLIETRNVVLDEAYAEAHVDVIPGPYVMLAVSDTGTGMPDTIRDQVFEPFFSTKSGGMSSGLGLSMVYGFVKQSGGLV